MKFQKVLAILSSISFTNAATCGGGSIGDGICADPTLCCSQWGWCGSSSAHCTGNPPPAPSPVAPSPIAPSPTYVAVPTVIAEEDSRLIAYLGNWQSCPTAAQVAEYTHIVIAFAVSYTWSPWKNQCSQTCEIAEPPICNNAPNPTLVSQWQAAGKKVILSFGGAGMGGSWAGDVNDCWEYCYGRETQVVDRLVEIVNDMGLDGVDLDFEYFLTPTSVFFLNQVTIGLRNNLPTGSEITHAPMDPDIMPGQPYYDDVLLATGHLLDFLMPQYYNGYTRPAIDGVGGTGVGSVSALSHYTTIVNGIFGGDATRMVFGFCISDCSSTNSNANGQQASQVMTDLANTYPCNGGAFFWVAEHDFTSGWSSVVGPTIRSLSATRCSSSPVTPSPTEAPVTTGPTKTITSSPTVSPTTSPPTKTPSLITPTPTHIVSPVSKCCEPNETSLKAYNACTQYYTCLYGEVQPGLVGPMTNGALFNQDIQNWDWSWNFQCYVDPCGGTNPPETAQPTPIPTVSPTASPLKVTPAPIQSPTTPSPTLPPPNGGDPCCPAGYTGLRAWDNCLQYYHCVGGVVTGGLLSVPPGTLFDQNIQNINWDYLVTCEVDNCGRRLRGRKDKI